MKELVDYLDEFVEELRDQLMDPKVMRDNRWRKRPFLGREMKDLPFRKGARKGKLGLQMAKESLIVWVRENDPEVQERIKPKKDKPCKGC